MQASSNPNDVISHETNESVNKPFVVSESRYNRDLLNSKQL